MTTDWTMLSIDDLQDTDYEGFFRIMQLTVKQYLEEQRQDDQIFSSLVLDCVSSSYSRLVHDEKKQQVFLKLLNLLENNSFLTRVVKINLLRHVEKEKSGKDQLFYNWVIKEGLINELCIDFRRTIKLVILKAYGKEIESIIGQFMDKHDLMERIMIEDQKTQQEKSDTQLDMWDVDWKERIEDWDSNASQFEADLKSLKSLSEKKITLKLEIRAVTDYLGQIFRSLLSNKEIQDASKSQTLV